MSRIQTRGAAGSPPRESPENTLNSDDSIDNDENNFSRNELEKAKQYLVSRRKLKSEN